MITKEEVLAAQKAWGDGIVWIGSQKGNLEKVTEAVEAHLHNLYAYDEGTPILFKPTKAASVQFRPTFEAAKSYFMGHDENFPEDKGFALEPWTNVMFDNSGGIILDEGRAFAMGNYYFTNVGGDIMKVEYTFGYVRVNGGLKIDVHYSGVPYQKLLDCERRAVLAGSVLSGNVVA